MRTSKKKGGVGSVMPRSVPASFAVKPDRSDTESAQASGATPAATHRTHQRSERSLFSHGCFRNRLNDIVDMINRVRDTSILSFRAIVIINITLRIYRHVF